MGKDQLQIHTPNRPGGRNPRITELQRARVNRELAASKIFCLPGPTGLFYEGVDHSEAIIMLEDFMMRTGTKGSDIALANMDSHDDILQWVYRPDHVFLGSWIRSAHKLGYFNKDVGLYYVFRRSGEFMDLAPEENFAVYGDYGKMPPSNMSTGIKTILMDFDAVATDEAAKLLLKHCYHISKRD
jgi:hypothetical protein